MKMYFSIGETAQTLNLKPSTLRYYDEIGLVIPEYVDPETGYRYYTIPQFQKLDRIRYLKNIGLSLPQIQEVIETGKVDTLMPFLNEKKREYKQHIRELRGKVKEIDWYMDYFKYLDSEDHSSDFYIVQKQTKYLAAAPYYPEDEFLENDLRLSRLKSSESFQNLKYLRQWSYVFDYESLRQKKFAPRYSAITINGIPNFESENILMIPGGNYLCFRAKLLSDDFGCIGAVDSYLKKLKISPKYALANEYEDNFKEYVGNQYEIQILI